MADRKKDEFIVWRTAKEGIFLHEGRAVTPPDCWCFVPSGDPGLTRRLKASGDYWLLVHKRKNRIESLGVWTSTAVVQFVKKRLEVERADPAYQEKLDASRRTREKKQTLYEREFKAAVLKFLDFSPRYIDFAEKFAEAVTRHAVPVGSGTVARTERIPLEQRAESAVIAWMRHKTTAYDHMQIARIKGERREIRRRLAELSRFLLTQYRAGNDVDLLRCPLALALGKV